MTEQDRQRKLYGWLDGYRRAIAADDRSLAARLLARVRLMQKLWREMGHWEAGICCCGYCDYLRSGG